MEIVAWIFFFIVVLLFVLFVLAVYVGAPLALLWAFFRSGWIPRGLKPVVGWTLGVLLALYAGFVYKHRQIHRQETEQARHQHQHQPHPVRLTVQQPGLLPYPLGWGNIEQACYGPTRRLVVTGVLPDGSLLRARFAASPGFAPPHETDVVAVTTPTGSATQATGRSVYEPGARTVSGSFRCVLPSGKQLSVSFPPTPVPLPAGASGK